MHCRESLRISLSIGADLVLWRYRDVRFHAPVVKKGLRVVAASVFGVVGSPVLAIVAIGVYWMLL